MKCELCGTPVKVEGHTTRHYVSEYDTLIAKSFKLREALASKCMCWPLDDVRHTRNPCHACRAIEEFDKETK